MYTFLITQDNSIIATHKDKIIEKANLSDKLQFIVGKTYNEYDMKDFVVSMFYISPISNTVHTEEMVLEDENYKGGYYCYKMPEESDLVQEAGDIMFNISFKKDIISEETGESAEYVRNIARGTLTVLPVNQFDVPEGSKDSMDKIMAIISSMIEQTKENVEHYPKIYHGNWYIWNSAIEQYEDTGVSAVGEDGEDGVGIDNVYLNDDYTLTFEYTDGSSYTTPSIRGEKGEQGIQGERGSGISSVEMNNDNTLTIYFDNGSSYTTAPIKGEKGDRGERGEKGDTGASGRSISATVLNPNYTLTIYFDDGTDYTTPSIRGIAGQPGKDGKDGKDGKGIVSMVMNSDYTISFILSDGTTYVTIPLRGERGLKGEKGDKGDVGATGQDGKNGEDGNGITDITFNQDYTLTITLEDGSQYTTESIRGEQGVSGQNGADGAKGDKGDPGDDYILTAADKTEIARIAAEEIDLSSYAKTADLPTKVSDLTDDSGHYTKPASGIPASDLAEEYVKDVQVNGVSVLSDGVANVPIANASTIGVVKINPNNGIGIDSNKDLYVNYPTDTQVKNGTANYRPLVPSKQHAAAFYGLAKASGDATQSASSNAVGTYTDEAKIAIQKMLGIYQAPWELIREDTFTNETEANHIIMVDRNGQAFQLTDVVFFFETPKQETYSKKGAYGQVWFTLNGSDGTRVQTESGAWEQQANTSAHGLLAIGEQRDGMMFLSSTAQTSTTNSYSVRYRYMGFGESYQLLNGGVFPLNIFTNSDVYITKIVIPSVTGTGHYRLYGKRKWQ